MAAKPITEDEVKQIAEEVRKQFLRDYSDSDQFDPRDLQKVRNDLEYVAKFVRQQRGNHDNAINNMVESLKWRHSFGVNDIQFEDIEDYLWRSGMANTHGVDKKGNNIVILNIRIHRRDSKKSRSLLRWIAFCFEAHRRAFPMGKMCMIFDMTGCGLSQMDMELMRFIVNCFKIYWPDLLHILLVYNMPWILQAAWKIVQSWLSDGAVAKVKFVNSETILEYVNSEQLIEALGGSDSWQFDYETERIKMLNQIQEVLERERREREGQSDSQTQSSEIYSSDMEQDPSGMESVEVSSDQVEEGGAMDGAEKRLSETDKKTEEPTGGEGRKVRFSSNLPPSRQSRYGHDSEREEERQKMTSPDNQQLLKGSAASHGFRRRQVHKLISLQNDTKASSTERQNSDSATYPFTHIQLNPASELLFSGSRDNELHCTLTLSNIGQEAAIFKIKTTAPRRYKVRPNLALIQTKSVAEVQVLLVPGSPSTTISGDKFLVQIFSFSASDSVPSQNQLLPFWRALSDTDITEHRMRCKWVKELTPSLIPSPTTPDTLPLSPPISPASPSPHNVATLTQRDIRNINDKLDKLVRVNQDLSKRLRSLYYWTILIVLGLLVILIVQTVL